MESKPNKVGFSLHFKVKIAILSGSQDARNQQKVSQISPIFMIGEDHCFVGWPNCEKGEIARYKDGMGKKWCQFWPDW